MNNLNRIVTKIPLENIWNESNDIIAEKIGYINGDKIKNLLKETQIKFLIADVGLKLEWIKESKSIEFWKSECKDRIINNPDNIEIENFKDNYCYLASEWRTTDENPIILLEKFH